MSPQDLLQEFGRKAGIDARVDENGRARLVFDRRFVVDLEHDADAAMLHVHGVVGSVPAQDREALYARMLSANLFGRGTGQCVLGIDEVAGEVLLSRALHTEGLDHLAFAKALEGFVTQVVRWSAEINSGAAMAVTEAQLERIEFLPPGAQRV